jgi:hypothetical protein
MILLLLLNTLITAQLKDTVIYGMEVYCNIGKEWNAEEGDTLLFTTKVPLYSNEYYYLLLTGDARQLQVWYKITDNLPVDEWAVGINNTNGKYHLLAWWDPWSYYELQIAFVAMYAGTRELNIFFEKWRN